MTSIYAAILAGGESRRMGRDKARLEREGRTLLERTVELAREVVGPTMVVGRGDVDFQVDEELTCVEDDHPRLGPIGGLATALRAVDGAVLLVACDMPLLDEEVFEWVVDVEGVSEHDGYATVRDGGVEPLFSVYFPSILSEIERRIDRERLGLRGLVDAGDFVHREIPDWLADRLANVNTPEQWREVANRDGR